MKRRVDGVQVQLWSRHVSERSLVFVVLPISVSSNDNNFIAEEFSSGVILLPESGHKDFENGMRRKTLVGESGKADGVRSDVRRHIVCETGFGQGKGSKRGESLAVRPRAYFPHLLESYMV